MTHEFGHALGLEHSDEAHASMSSTTSLGELSKRDVHEDDIQGFVSLYPFQEGDDSVDPTAPNTDEGNESSGGNSGVDNALIPSAGSTGGNAGPVSLEKAGCSAQPTSSTRDLGLVWILGLLLISFRRVR